MSRSVHASCRDSLKATKTTQRAVAAFVATPNRRANRELFDLAGGALNRPIPYVDDEVGFAEELAVAGDPRPAEDVAATGEHVLHKRTPDAAAIDVKRGYL